VYFLVDYLKKFLYVPSKLKIITPGLDTYFLQCSISELCSLTHFQALKSFNTILTKNAGLRDEIDNLRVERSRFEELQRRLERELAALRKEIGEVIENSTQAYDQREEAQAKMVLMRDKEDKDKGQLNSELKELIRVIDHDKKLKVGKAHGQRY
jgi:hypothetical protein